MSEHADPRVAMGTLWHQLGAQVMVCEMELEKVRTIWGQLGRLLEEEHRSGD